MKEYTFMSSPFVKQIIVKWEKHLLAFFIIFVVLLLTHIYILKHDPVFSFFNSMMIATLVGIT